MLKKFFSPDTPKHVGVQPQVRRTFVCMNTDALGGGVLILVSALLWMGYLVPTWFKHRQYISTERNTVRLQQTMRILAETAEIPEQVHVETTAREVAEQRRILRRLEREKKNQARKAVHEKAQPKSTVIEKASPPVSVQARRRRGRVFAVTMLIVGASGLIMGVPEAFMQQQWTVVAVAGIFLITAFSTLRMLKNSGVKMSDQKKQFFQKQQQILPSVEQKSVLNVQASPAHTQSLKQAQHQISHQRKMLMRAAAMAAGRQNVEQVLEKEAKVAAAKLFEGSTPEAHLVSLAKSVQTETPHVKAPENKSDVSHPQAHIVQKKVRQHEDVLSRIGAIDAQEDLEVFDVDAVVKSRRLAS